MIALGIVYKYNTYLFYFEFNFCKFSISSYYKLLSLYYPIVTTIGLSQFNDKLRLITYIFIEKELESQERFLKNQSLYDENYLEST